jgi:hypothetical protein
MCLTSSASTGLHAAINSRSPPHPCGRSYEGPLDLDSDELFYFLLVGYRPYGGLARRTEVTRHFPAALQAVALHFEWCNDSWYPLVQFDSGGDGLRAGFGCVLAELAVLPAARTALWFIEPSPWLAQWRPADLIEVSPARVHEAARVERYVAVG